MATLHDPMVKWIGLEDPDFMVQGEDFGYQTLYASIDTTLMGNSTYQEILGFGVPFRVFPFLQGVQN